jgi:hypothetical protein
MKDKDSDKMNRREKRRREQGRSNLGGKRKREWRKKTTDRKNTVQDKELSIFINMYVLYLC